MAAFATNSTLTTNAVKIKHKLTVPKKQRKEFRATLDAPPKQALIDANR
jgi:hypothetical protein